ncbi:hypothetical protein BGZ65_005898 [Modicella reniformis]|uniref:LNS2/PITP domain-containing protein n=1 Tax=Modicella reniformis TaxID=1440133 RepID=A0A9P6SV33_9FUNG|nr:hypothetical protein BGZ65_005898 [Modicella reniformis]
MNTVGSFFSSVTKFYNEINPATLSGAIDIIVVQQANGDLACSPFHVRFGKLSVLRPQEKVVEVRVNGEAIPFSMKVGDAGEAFFVLETNDYVPDEFATSPIAQFSDEADLAPVDYFDLNAKGQPQEQRKQLGGITGEYRQADEDTLLENGYVSAASGHGSAFEESLKDDSDHESLSSAGAGRIKGDAARDGTGSLVLNMPGSFGQSHGSLQEPESPLPEPSRDPTRLAKGDKDDINFPVNTVFPVVQEDENKQNHNSASGVARVSRRTSEVLFDMTGYKTDSCSESSDDEDDLPQGILSDSERHHRRLRKKFGKKASHLSKEQRQKLLDDIKQSFIKSEEERPNEKPPAVARGTVRLNDSQPKTTAAKTETLPKRETRISVVSDTEMDYETRTAPKSTQGKEWTWGWGSLPVKQNNPDEDDGIKEEGDKSSVPEVPAEIETKEFQLGSTTYRIAVSLCGEDEFGKDLAACHKAFKSAQLTFEAFSKDPATVLADKKLPLADAASQDIRDQKNLAAEGRTSSTRFGTISRWFRKAPVGVSSSASTPDVPNTSTTTTTSGESGAVAVGPDDTEVRPANKALRSKSLPPMDTGRTDDHEHTHVPTLSEKPADGSEEKKRYAKTLRLTSEQLRSLGLRKGANTVSFSVSSAYQGTATCVAKIFLWDYDAQVVISDIDGTITKSDALGHIFAMAGRDWTHLGVAKLFTDIRSNGYHVLYLTSRAIGQADYTRKYLQKVEQNSYQLPDGPVIMSPDRLFSAFHREVIIRKPEVFKMACLRDVKSLFGDRNPFYAGFGNRITDALSYRSVNVPPSRIFTIDSYGEVKLELLSAFKSSYLALNDLVNEIFPGQRVAPEFNDWNFWKIDLPKIELPDLPLAPNTYGIAGSSASLLSSTTSVAKRVVSLTHSSTNGLLPTSPTTTAADAKKTSYASALLGRSETLNSDDESQDHQDDIARQGSKDDSKRTRATSPSVLSALNPTRLIRAVRSGNTQSTSPTQTPQSPEIKGIIGSLPSSPSMVGDDAVRPLSAPSPLPLDGLVQTDENVASASKKVLDRDFKDGLVNVKVEDEDEETTARRLLRGFNQGADSTAMGDEEFYGEEEYQGDYDDADYADEEDQGDLDDEDDEYLEQIQVELGTPFL